MAPMRYAVYHKNCGHAIAVVVGRHAATDPVDRVPSPNRFALRTRMATHFDVANVTQGVTCNICREAVLGKA